MKHPESNFMHLSDLHNTDCQVCKSYPAVDYIIQGLGYKINEVEENAVDQLSIPVCEHCVAALHSELFVLLYCVNCFAYRWVYKACSYREYEQDFNVLPECPECKKEAKT